MVDFHALSPAFQGQLVDFHVPSVLPDVELVEFHGWVKGQIWRRMHGGAPRWAVESIGPIDQVIPTRLKGWQAEPSPCTRQRRHNLLRPERGRCVLRVNKRGQWAQGAGGRQGCAESRWTPGRVWRDLATRASAARRPGATSARGCVGSAQPAGHPAAGPSAGERARAWRSRLAQGSQSSEGGRRRGANIFDARPGLARLDAVQAVGIHCPVPIEPSPAGAGTAYALTAIANLAPLMTRLLLRKGWEP